MKLVLARHGEADNTQLDSARNLTDIGRQDMRRMAHLLSGTGWKFTEFRCSPVLRARQTAEILSGSFRSLTGRQVPIVEEKTLSPGVDLDAALALLSLYGPSDAAVWVLHMPDIAHLASRLLGLNEPSFYFPPGTMLGLNLTLPHTQDRTMLIWQVLPEFVREILPLS